MPISIQTNASIRTVLKHKEQLVPISGYVAKTDQKVTIIYPGLDSSERFEVPTASVRHATQYINMLSSVLKTMNEMQSGIIRNIK